MKSYLKIFLTLSLILNVTCNSQSSIPQELKKGDLLLLKSDFDNCGFSYLEKQELILLHIDNGKYSELNINYPGYNYDYPSISPSGKMMITKHVTNENLFLYKLKEDLLTEIPYHKIRASNILRFGPAFEFYNDSIIVIALKGDLFSYNINQETFVKIVSFGKKNIDEIHIPEYDSDKIFLKFEEMGDLGEVSNTQYGLYNFNGITLENEKSLNIQYLMDISPDGNIILEWRDSLYTYNLTTEATKRIFIFERLNKGLDKIREVKFLDDDSIIFTDIINENNECYSKLIIYNFIQDEVEKEYNLGEYHFEVIRVYK